MAAVPLPREALQQPAELADLEVRAWIPRLRRPAPTPTPDDQDQAEQYMRVLKKARVVHPTKVTKEEALEASLYEHAVKSRMVEDAMAGAPQWAVALQASVTALQVTVTALQVTVTANQASLAALARGQAEATSRCALEDARRFNKAANPRDEDPDAPIACPITAAGALPAGHPTTRRQLWALGVAHCDAMLAYYGLVQAGLAFDKRRRLAQHLGVRP